jgi:2,4-dienoyl-CoA reductase (NADPH2)
VVLCAHLTNYACDGLPTEQHAAYYARRAAGGAGLIITEEHSVHPADQPYEKLIQGYRPGVIPGYRRITGAVHAHGVPVLAQLNHNGGQSSGMYSRLPVRAPSPVPDPLFREVPSPAGPDEIAEIVAGYARVARHCAEGGFDGVELQCSQSSLIRGFLSAAANQRTDRYGGSLRNRARLLLEVVAAVREAIGPGRALGVRLCGDEMIEGGTTLDEAVEVARMAGGTGAVDYISTTMGGHRQPVPGRGEHGPPRARAVRPRPRSGPRWRSRCWAQAGSPARSRPTRRWPTGSVIWSAWSAGRSPTRTSRPRPGTGQAAAIRTCLSCNQECAGRVGRNRWLGCTANPAPGANLCRCPRRRGAGPRPGAASTWSAAARAACRPQ